MDRLDILKYSLLSLYNAACLYVSRADHLVLDHQMVVKTFSFPGEDDSSHSQHYLVSCVSLCRTDALWSPLIPVHFNISIVVVLVHF